MRVANWEQVLSEYLQTQSLAPFEWGVNDCCHFAAKAAELITGVGYGDRYPCDSSSSAQVLLLEHGGVIGIADQHYERIDTGFVWRGDIVAAKVSGSEDYALGICQGLHAVFKSADGLSAKAMSDIEIAWRVN